MDQTLSPTDLSKRAGISRGYACDLLKGNKSPSDGMSVHIFRATGVKLGRVVNLTDEEIDVLEKMHGTTAKAA